MKMVQKAFTLLELIIAISLTLIIMSTLLYFYRDLSKIGQATDKLSASYFYWQYTGSRLADILPKTVGEPATKDKDFIFYTVEDSPLTKPGSPSLIFIFDNGVSLDKLFSNHVLARLYVDHHNQLTLIYGPTVMRWKERVVPNMKKEILKENIDSIAFEFFVPPDKSRTGKQQPSNIAEPEPKGGWRKSWQKEFGKLPALIKITITPLDKTEPVVYVFPLVNGTSRITYD